MPLERVSHGGITSPYSDMLNFMMLIRMNLLAVDGMVIQMLGQVM